MSKRIKVVSGIILRGNKIVLVRKKDRRMWTLPGGKREFFETDIVCLRRELTEELPCLSMKYIKNQFRGEFVGLAPYGKYEICIRAYFVKVPESIWRIMPVLTPGAEIEAACLTSTPLRYPLSEVTGKIISSLRRDGIVPNVVHFP